MGIIEDPPDVNITASEAMETTFQNLDIERLFVDSDEMEVMKTLQNMHLANFQLDNEIKSIVIEEIESILLYSGNMLSMCNLLKQTQTAINQLATLCRTFDTTYDDVESEKDAGSDCCEDLMYFMDHGATQHQLDGSLGNIIDNTERIGKIQVLGKTVQLLKRLAMDNFRLLKRNKFVKSYKLLKMKTPVLMEIVKQILKNEEMVDDETVMYCSEHHQAGRMDSEKEVKQPTYATGRHTGDRLLGNVSPEQFKGFITEMQVILDYNTSKLLNNCEKVLGSSNMGLLIEASICLVLANEHDGDYTNRLWEMRRDATKLESGRLLLGCLGSCEELMAQLLTSVICHIFCQRINEHTLVKLKRLLESSEPIGNVTTPRQLSHVELAFNEQSYWLAAMDLIRRNLERMDLDELVDFYNALTNYVTTVTKQVDSNELVLNVFAALGVHLAKEVTRVSEDMLNQVKEIYRKTARASGMRAVEDVEVRMKSHEMCISQIKALGMFVSRIDSDIAMMVDDRMADVLRRINTHIQEIKPPTPAEGVLDTYGEEGSVQTWLRQSGVGNIILDVEALWNDMQKDATDIMETVAKKCIVPLGAENNTLKTLIGSGALSSQYTLLGARLFAQCLKRITLELCLDMTENLTEHHKALLVLCFRDSPHQEECIQLTKRIKELEIELGETTLNEHRQTYESLRNFI